MRTWSFLILRAGFPAAVLALWWLFPLGRSEPGPALNWYKGNLHTHTINSDGDSSPGTVARWYKEHRYHFLVLSDHNYLTGPGGLNDFLAAGERFLLIPGEEVTATYEEKAVHVNAFRIAATIEPYFGTGLVDTIQGNVDAVHEAGGLPSLNHPNFRWSISPADLARIERLRLFEVYNGHPGVNNHGGGGSPGLDAMWDEVLTAGRRLFGVAVDDAHVFKRFGPQHSNPGRGWVAVRAPELSTEAILGALERGDFYASTGVELENVTRGTRSLTVQIRPEGDFKYTTEFIGEDGRILETSFGNPASYDLKAGEQYVRAKVRASDGSVAWVQPVWAE